MQKQTQIDDVPRMLRTAQTQHDGKLHGKAATSNQFKANHSSKRYTVLTEQELRQTDEFIQHRNI